MVRRNLPALIVLGLFAVLVALYGAWPLLVFGAVLIAIRTTITSGELCRCGHRCRAHRGIRQDRCRHCKCQGFELADFDDFSRLAPDDRVSARDFDEPV